MNMEFKFEGTIYVEDCDLEEMKQLMKTEGMSAEEAFEKVSIEWDDEDYYLSPYIREDVIAFITQN